MGKGGGGSPAPAPSQQTVTQTAIPEYARPYVETMLGKTEALTDINQNPYQAYGGQRIQEFTPLQQRAFGDVANMQVAPQIGMGTGLAAASGLGALGAGSDYMRMATDPRAIQSFMSPYMQNVVDLQKQEATRDYQKGLGMLGARAAASGAFGGTRSALERAEAARNLNTQLANIQAQGTQNAFQQAQQAQQFGSQLGLQGLGQGLQAAQTLGQLGQTGFGQQMGILGEQQKVGAVQQAQGQQALDLAYQDFLKQRNYPYQQLAFMSDMLRGLPLSQSAQQVYTAPPNMASQLGGLGMAGLGIYGMSGGFRGAKEGGAIKGYKNGGKIGYLSGGEIKMMTTQQLTELLDNPNLSPMEVQMVEQALMLRRRMEMNPEADQMMARSGIGSIATGDMVPEQMAGGGIIAFSKGESVKLPDDYAERRKRLSEREEELFKKIEDYDFSKSEAAQKQYETDIAERKQQLPWETLTALGLGTMQGSSDPATRQTFLGNLAAGGEKALGQYGRGLAQIDAAKKEQLRGATDLEKAKYARDVQRLGSLQSSINQLDSKQIALMNARNQAEYTKALREQQAYTKAYEGYQKAIRDEKELVRKAFKDQFNFDMDVDEAEQQAIKRVQNRIKGTPMEGILFPQGAPEYVVPPAPKDEKPSPAPAPVKTGKFKVTAPNGKEYTFPTQEAADQFRKAVGMKQ